MKSTANWLSSAKWGLMFHYIDKPASSNCPSGTSAEDWNRRIDGFDVARFVGQVKELGADYVIFTLGQNTGHFCSPNETYDTIVGIVPSKLSSRDLMLEIAEGLLPEAKLVAYLPSHAPSNDAEAVKAFNLVPPWDGGMWGLPASADGQALADERLTEFQTRWQSVISDWGLRWGDKVAGWWIDGCYFSERMYAAEEEPNFTSLSRALRAGNPGRVLAFNSGTARPFERLSLHQDYTAGEVSNQFPVGNKWHPMNGITEEMTTHVLTYLGDWWGEGAARFDAGYVHAYTRYLNERGGVMTWDVPIGLDGAISEEFMNILRVLKR